MFYSNATTWINPASALEGRLLIPVVLPLMILLARGVKYARRWLPMVALILLTGCTLYALPGGGYGADVQIRVYPPVVQASLTPVPTFEDPTPTHEFATSVPAVMVRNTSGQYYNIRAEASTSAGFLELFAPGDVLELQAVLTNGWLMVERAGGGTGFVHPGCCIDPQ